MSITHHFVFSGRACKSDALPAIRYTLIFCSTPKIKYVRSYKRKNISSALMSETNTVGSVNVQTTLVVIHAKYVNDFGTLCFVEILHLTLQNLCFLLVS